MHSTFSPPAWYRPTSVALLAGAVVTAMLAQQRWGSQLLPHSFCINASPGLLGLHLVSDSLIALAYLIIPGALLYFTRRRPDIPFGWIAWVFGAFIVACGLTHVFDVWTLYYPVYWLSGVTKTVTAAASLATAWLLFRLMPQAIAMPSAQQLRDANAALTSEVQARQLAERQLHAAKLQVEELLGKAQRRADETAAILQRFFDEAPMAMALLDGDAKVMRANASLEAILPRTGAAEPDSGGAVHLTQLPPPVAAALGQVQESGERCELDVMLGTSGDPHVLRCSVFAIPVDGGCRYGWIAMDVSAQVAAFKANWLAMAALADANRSIAEEKAQFHALADNIAQLAWMTDETGWIYWYNRRWFDYTGTTMDQMQGLEWRAVHHPDHVQRVLDKFRAHLASGEAWEDTFPLRGANGEFRWFLSRAFPLRNAYGEIVRWFGTNTDINEQVLAQEALREADRRKNEFIASLAHELRNPLAPVRNAAEIVARVGADDPRIERASQILQRQVKHMARLIDDLLDVAKISRNKLTADLGRCDLAKIAGAVASDYESSLQAAGNTLVLDLAGPLPIQGDPVRLAQAIGNYLQNAMRFAPGTPVTVSAFLDAATGEAVARVHDGGPGIPADLMPALFRPFTQGEQDLARSRGGLGLGLALNKGIAELHGGKVCARNHAQGGAVFEIRVPLVKEDEGSGG